MTRAFLDTNILIYIYSVDEPDKRKQAITQMNSYYRIVSTQILSEFCSVSIRKLMQPNVIEESLSLIRRKNKISIVTLNTIKKGIYIQSKYNFTYYDSLIIASALETECDFLITEDLQNGQLFEEKLTIFNILV
ncbi:MAG: PIN domain-containing protein [Streptococcaceae bacterium]|nr:PIN domain-containing protein [Streptococcaceae bacterium]